MNHVLVVDDFQAFRRFITSALESRPGFRIAGEASDGVDAVEQALRLQPSLILLDVGLPKLDGISAARRIREHVPGAKILFISAERSPAIAEEALRTGARGYVLKSDLGKELWPAIDAVLRGAAYVSSGVVTPVQAAAD